MGRATSREGISAELQERIRSFTAFYEENAYLAYNLALRIACASDGARRAVQRAFLQQLQTRPAGLVGATAEAALREASLVADVTAAGDAEAQRLLTAIATAAPAERAALALADLTDADCEGIGAALGVPAAQAQTLLDRGRAAFAAGLGRSPDEGEEAARGWMWAAPPDHIWQELYPAFHRAVEGQLRAGAGPEQTLVLRPDSPSAPAAATRRTKRRLARVARPRRPRWGVVLPALALLVALGGGAAATQLTGSSSAGGSPGSHPGAQAAAPIDEVPSEAATGDDEVKPRKPLTAALLDKLRLRELRQLREYGRRQADTSLPARQRSAASRRITAIERAARQRLRAQQRREAAQRDREARQRARSNAPPPPPATAAPRRSPVPRPQTQPPRQTTTPGGPPRDRGQAEQSCLRDEDTGQYICPP